jgi:hypothetical protein
MKTNRTPNSVFLLALLTMCIALAGCADTDKVIWRAESKSPDGAWLALAHTETTAGPGNNAQWTMVEIQQNISSGQPLMVLDFDEDQASVKALTMNWTTSSHLDVKYKGDALITFQAIKAFGKDVTVEHLP